MATRTIQVNYMARVEGEASLVLRTKDGVATDVEFRIFEPPRLFESLLRGRSPLEAPDITARICGICPVAYQMSACHAVEDALGVRVEGALRALRRLLYCGEWIESHALHMVLLHAPDFFGLEDGIALAKVHPEEVRRGLRIKKAGNAIVRVLGGREIHPINVRVGGFYRVPSRPELDALLSELRWSLGAAQELVRWMGAFEFPALERDWELVALRHPDEYPMNEGRVASTRGLDVDVHDYEDEFVETHAARSNALHSTRRGGGPYLTGPLARFALNAERLAPEARETARAVHLEPPCKNPFKSLLVRGVEVVHALAVAVRIIEGYEAPQAASVPIEVRAGTGMAATAAPRGLLYHRYVIGDDALLREAKIVPPTSQNQLAIEDDLRALAPELAAMPLAAATWRAEQAIRNHDPCISCATHFLRLRLEDA
jgi:coenzyme F420-reducing hydrogenase alpha subunit